MKARKIELKTLEIVEPGTWKKHPMAYVDLLGVVISSTGTDQFGRTMGMGSDDVIKAVELKMDLKKANGVWHLQETDYNWILARLNNVVHWTVDNEQLVEFIKDVRTAPLVDLEASPPKE